MSVRSMPLPRPGTYSPLADVVLPRPTGRAAAVARDTALILAGSLLVAASARVAIPLPFSPVPITGQTFGVLLVGMLLGSRRGAMSLALYLLEGAAGLPVFSSGTFGLTILRGATAGYLFSYPLAAFLLGWLTERGWDRKPLWTATAMVLGGFLILGLGSLWLTPFVGGYHNAFFKGVVPFLPGDIVKTVLAACLLPGGWRLLGKPKAGTG